MNLILQYLLEIPFTTTEKPPITHTNTLNSNTKRDFHSTRKPTSTQVNTEAPQRFKSPPPPSVFSASRTHTPLDLLQMHTDCTPNPCSTRRTSSAGTRGRAWTSRTPPSRGCLVPIWSASNGSFEDTLPNPQRAGGI